MTERIEHPVHWVPIVMRQPHGGYAIGAIDFYRLTEEQQGVILNAVSPLVSKSTPMEMSRAVGDYLEEWDEEVNKMARATREEAEEPVPVMPKVVRNRESVDAEVVSKARGWMPRLVWGGRNG